LAINSLIFGRVLALDSFGLTSCPSGEKSRAIDSTSALFHAASNDFTSFWSAAPSRELSSAGLGALAALPEAIVKHEKKIEAKNAVNDGLASWMSILKTPEHRAGVLLFALCSDDRP
jgi:hypothetical protein